MTAPIDQKQQAEALKQSIRVAKSPFSQVTICGLLRAEMMSRGQSVTLARLSDIDTLSVEQLQMAEEILPTVIGASLPDATVNEIAVIRRTASQ